MFEQLKNFDWNSFSQALMTGEAHRYLLVAIIIIICSSLMYMFLAIGCYSDKAKFYAKFGIYIGLFALGLAFWTASSNMNDHKSDMDKSITMNSDSSLKDMMDDNMKQLKEKGVL
jgi:hypothetical protein